MKKLVLIGVPSSAGAHNRGQEKGPSHLRQARLIESLTDTGWPIVDGGDLPGELFRPDAVHKDQRNLAAVLRNAERVRDRARQVVSEGAIPLFLGGDCTLTIGAAAGISDTDRTLGVAYLDGDADLDVPGPGWGILDSMGVAHLRGHGVDALAGLGRTRPLVGADGIVLFGYHPAQLSPAQTALLAESGLTAYPIVNMVDPRASAIAARETLRSRSDQLLVHLDIDVIDYAEFPLADCPRYHGGLAFDTTMDCLSIFLAAPELAAVVIAEVNPDHDPNGALAARLVAGLAGAFSRARRIPAAERTGNSPA